MPMDYERQAQSVADRETTTIRMIRPIRRCLRASASALIIVALSAVSTWSRDNLPSTPPPKGPQSWVNAAAPIFDRRAHYVGEVWISVSNDGSFGTSHQMDACPQDEIDLRINWCPSFELPGGSRIDYLYNGGLWVGGIIGTDTVITLGYEGWDETGDEFNGYTTISTELPADYRHLGCSPNADGSFAPPRRLEQIYYCQYEDTTLTNTNQASHIPMGLEVTQVTHQSSTNFARNFVIWDLEIRNIGDNLIRGVYLGVFVDTDIYWQLSAGGSNNANDDISGFLHTWPNPVNPEFRDTLNIAWAADNDGKPEGDGPEDPFRRQAERGIIGWRVLRAPAGANISYNWWTSSGQGLLDWGPRRLTDLRVLGHGGRGTPSGDRNKYHYMSNREIDYDQLYAGIDLSAFGWARPLAAATSCNLADGLDTRSVLAVGPVPQLAPGESIPFTFAMVGGSEFHTVQDNPINCNDPTGFYNNVDFSDLAGNAWWAGFVFDNFGVDTDNNDYAGDYYPVQGSAEDTIFYRGDGCPDFAGPAPPRGPDNSNLTLISRPHELELNWTGANSELQVDPLLRVSDFEGYRLYIAERNTSSDIPSSGDYSLLASWDIVDYRRYTFRELTQRWELTSNPLTVDQWREVFDDPDFDPELYLSSEFDAEFPRDSAYQYLGAEGEEQRAYFVPQDYNQSNTIIDQEQPRDNLIQRIDVRDTIIGLDTLQYGVYRVVLENRLPSKYYFVSVTAFDFGDPENDLDPLETVPGGQNNRVGGIPIYSSDVVENYWGTGGAQRDSVRVSVYPNPYKSVIALADGNSSTYFDEGLEGTFGQETFGDRDRRIHFINLPDSATVSIYTLDGDLVRELHHPDPTLSSYPSKISWDLVSRNTQAVESGIYIYRVDSKLGAQIGKLVIIK